MRTVLQTAVAAHAPLQDHVLDVLRAAPAEVAQRRVVVLHCRPADLDPRLRVQVRHLAT